MRRSPRPRIKRICRYCGDEFMAKQYEIERGRGKYCSTWCSAAAQTKQVELCCETCGKKYKVKLSKKERSKFCCPRCKSKFLRKGGITHDKHGYILIKTEMGYRKRARIVMEQKLGRPLQRGEVVHHMNRDRADD